MQTFATPEPISAVIDLLVGDARITASDRVDTVVQVSPSDPHKDLDVRAAEQTRVEYADGRLLVKGPRQRGLGVFGKIGSVDLVVELPTGSGLRAETGVGTLRAEGRLGETRAKTGAGEVHLDQTGTLELTTGVGEVSVERIDGNADVTTGSGKLRLGEVTGAATVKNANGDTWLGDVTGDVRVRAANGDITVGHAHADVTASTANGSVRVDRVTQGATSLKTAMGGIEVGVSAGTAARLDVLTRFGQVHNRLESAGGPNASEQRVEVHARTSFGDIVVRRA